MHYFAWALILPHAPWFTAYYVLALHMAQSTSFGLFFALFYSLAYILLWLVASIDPIFSHSILNCFLAWLAVGVVQYFVGHRLLQGEFPGDRAVMSPLFRRMGIIYETLFGLAMLTHMLTSRAISKVLTKVGDSNFDSRMH